MHPARLCGFAHGCCNSIIVGCTTAGPPLQQIVAELLDLSARTPGETCSAARAAISNALCLRRAGAGQAFGRAADRRNGTSRTLVACYFLRAGDIEHRSSTTSTAPVTAEVSVRRVTAVQHGKPIFVFAAASTSRTRAEHQLSMPEVPLPKICRRCR